MTTYKFGLFGILAFLAFVVSFLVFAYITPGYMHSVNAISELGIIGAPYAKAFNWIGFGFVGLLVVAFSYGLRESLRPNAGATGISLLVALSGLGWACLGLFPAAPRFQPSLQTSLHFGMVTINYLSFVLAAFLYARKLRTASYWRSWALFSLAMGMIGIATFFIPKTLIAAAISQRIALVAYFLWIGVMGWLVARKAQFAEKVEGGIQTTSTKYAKG